MQRRKLDLADLDAVLAEAQRLHRTGYDKAGTWDLSQICRHAAAPIDRTITGFHSRSPLLMRMIARLFFKRAFFAKRRIKAGLRAPESTLSSPGDEAAALAALEAAIARFNAFQGPWPEHPIFGKLTPHEWREFHVIHTTHHLSFLIPRESK